MDPSVAPSAVLVVGAGFIGSHIASGYLLRGTPTTVLSRTLPVDPLRTGLDGARLIVGDASDAATAQRALEGVDQVVWSAGGLLPAESNRFPTNDLLAALPPLLVMLEQLVRHEGVRIVLVSSGGTVYGNPTVLPVPETYVPWPLSAHGVTRLAAEHYLGVYQDVHGVQGLALRCGNVFGPGQRSDRSQGLVAVLLSRVRQAMAVPIFGDGSAARDYVHIDDVVDVVCRLCERTALPRVINVGSGVRTSVSKLLDLVREITGRRVDVEYHPSRPGDVKEIVLDIALLQSLLPFEPTLLRDALSATWAADATNTAP